MANYVNIFLADDDPEDQEIFQDALKLIDQSIQCFCASDGEEAIQLLSSDYFQKPDIIFLDLNMPRLNGKQVLVRLKEIDGLQHIPVVMYSTFFSDLDIEEVDDFGAVHHLIKPPAFDELLSSLTQILNKKW
jgi:CheY-like chemotaxis protein